MCTPRPSRGVLSFVLLIACLLLPRVSPTANAAPVPLKTMEFGNGPRLVFVHGIGCSRMSCLPTAKLLRDRYRIVLVDLPGHGDSRTLPDPFSLEAVAEALDGVLAKQPADSTVIVADGVGGLAAIMALGAHPERAKGLFLLNAGLRSPIQIPDQDQRYFLEYLDKNYDAFLKNLFQIAGRDSTQGVAIHALAVQADPLAIKGYFRSVLNADGNKALRAWKGPITMAVSDKNWPEGKTWGETAKLLGWDDSTRVKPLRLERAAFWAMQDQPDTLARAIADYASAQLKPAK